MREVRGVREGDGAREEMGRGEENWEGSMARLGSRSSYCESPKARALKNTSYMQGLLTSSRSAHADRHQPEVPRDDALGLERKSQVEELKPEVI